MFKRAFTLVELLVVIAIIGILASTVVVNVSSSRKKARDARRKVDLQAIASAVEAYAEANVGYPTTAGVTDCLANPIGGTVPPGVLWCYEGTKGYGASGYVPGVVGGGQVNTLPADPSDRKNGSVANPSYCAPNGPGSEAGYWYASNGTDYKAVAVCSLEAAPKDSDPLNDPARPGEALATYSAGARTW